MDAGKIKMVPGFYFTEPHIAQTTFGSKQTIAVIVLIGRR